MSKHTKVIAIATDWHTPIHSLFLAQETTTTTTLNSPSQSATLNLNSEASSADSFLVPFLPDGKSSRSSWRSSTRVLQRTFVEHQKDALLLCTFKLQTLQRATRAGEWSFPGACQCALRHDSQIASRVQWQNGTRFLVEVDAGMMMFERASEREREGFEIRGRWMLGCNAEEQSRA